MRTPRAPFRRLAALAAAVLAAGTISVATGSPPASAAVSFTSTVANQASGDCADDPNSSAAAGTQLIQYSCNGGTNQSWTFTNLGSGIYKITASYATSLCLDVSNSGGSGANVDLWACSGANNQKWGAISISGNIYSLAPQNATSTRLDVNGNGTANGTQVDIYNSNGNNNQKWAVN